MISEREWEKYVEAHAEYFKTHPDELARYRLNAKLFKDCDYGCSALLVIYCLFVYTYLTAKYGAKQLYVLVPAMNVIIVIAQIMKQKNEKRVKTHVQEFMTLFKLYLF
jgi:hypothetical protein